MEKVIIQEIQRIKTTNKGGLQSASVMSNSLFEIKRQRVNSDSLPFGYK